MAFGEFEAWCCLRTTVDTVAFAAAFKGVFLEGLEAAIIIVTFGATAGQLPVVCEWRGGARERCASWGDRTPSANAYSGEHAKAWRRTPADVFRDLLAR